MKTILIVEISLFFLKGSPKIVVPKRDSIAFDFIHRNNTVCWISHGSSRQPSLESFIPVSSQSKSELMCTNVSESSSENRFLSFHSWSLPQPDMFDFNTVNHIAVDWLSNNWYFLDDTRELVLLCGLRFIPAKFLCKVVLSVGISKPRGIALDPNEGLMFLTIWGANKAKLIRANLDGRENRILVDTKIVYPSGITIDYPNKHVYWVDTYLDYIERINYDGTGRKTILRGSPTQGLHSATVFENILYVTSWKNNSILWLDRFKPDTQHGTLIEGIRRPFTTQVYHRQRQPCKHRAQSLKATTNKTNETYFHRCQLSNPCGHLCIPTKNYPYYKCICKAGYELATNGRRCIKAVRPQYLLFGQQQPGIIRGIPINVGDGIEEIGGDKLINVQKRSDSDTRDLSYGFDANKEDDIEAILPIINLSQPTAMDLHDTGSNVHLYIADSKKLTIERQGAQL